MPKFDFSKPEHQTQFDALPKEEQEKEINEAHGIALKHDVFLNEELDQIPQLLSEGNTCFVKNILVTHAKSAPNLFKSAFQKGFEQCINQGNFYSILKIIELAKERGIFLEFNKPEIKSAFQKGFEQCINQGNFYSIQKIITVAQEIHIFLEFNKPEIKSAFQKMLKHYLDKGEIYEAKDIIGTAKERGILIEPALQEQFQKEYAEFLSVDNQLKFTIKQLHDKYNPAIIFVTQTSATLLGFAIKELWKEAWPKEKKPKILTLNIRPFLYIPPIDEQQGYIEKRRLKKESLPYLKRIERLTKELKRNEKIESWQDEELVKKYREKLQKEINEENPIYDPGLDMPDESWPEFQKLVKEIEAKLSSYKITGNIAIIDECFAFSDYLSGQNFGPEDEEYQTKKVRATSTVNTAYYAIRKAYDNLGLNFKVVGLGTQHDRIPGGPWRRPEAPHQNSYYRVKTKEEKDEAKNRIKVWKDVGKITGKSIKKDGLREIGEIK